MAKLRINGDSSGYVDLEAPNAASSSTLDLDQVPQKNAANTFSAINKFADSVAIGGTHSPSNNLDVRSTGQAIVRVDGSGLYYNGIKIRNNYSSVQSDWNVGAAGGTSGWGSANGTFIIRDDTTNSTGLEIEQGAGSNTAALHIDSSGRVTTPYQPYFYTYSTDVNVNYSSGGILNFDLIHEQQGSHYSTANKRFTAPVQGVYSFTVIVYGNNATNSHAYAFHVNGAARVRGQVRDGTGDGYAPSAMIAKLSAGDYVDLRAVGVGVTNFYGGSNLIYSQFSGCLIG